MYVCGKVGPFHVGLGKPSWLEPTTPIGWGMQNQPPYSCPWPKHTTPANSADGVINDPGGGWGHRMRFQYWEKKQWQPNKYDVVGMLAGGVGITPMLQLIREVPLSPPRSSPFPESLPIVENHTRFFYGARLEQKLSVGIFLSPNSL